MPNPAGRIPGVAVPAQQSELADTPSRWYAWYEAGRESPRLARDGRMWFFLPVC